MTRVVVAAGVIDALASLDLKHPKMSQASSKAWWRQNGRYKSGSDHMFDLNLALRFGAALGLGLLLGLERERKRDVELLFGGIRTFALIALLGAVGAFMERELDESWPVLAIFVAVVTLVIVSYATTAARGELGITTEITAVLAYIVGALCGWDKVGVASVATVVCLLLL
ncbi:MAG: MgtC/SapB family protein, partial [Candidatus Binatia bacterium]